MSMDYWLQAFDHGEEGFLPLSIVEEAFGDALTDKNISRDKISRKILVSYHLKYPQQTEHYLSIEATDDTIPLISELAFVHAPGADAFWQSLVNILQATHTVLYWADTENALVIGQQETRQHLPPDMIETLGEPRVISSFEELWQP
ncbi:hypothetical protein HV127_06855 [Klebsiella sp. RHBSTW-00215]|uniref:hypothetical protein n=1 Tax=Klebsiella sp. RHBSTW-00215 TaxID=2742640 RepID=UPI0015F3D533|nr:hypothetical protein [Klebsiella sp. RHBSTW-00215]MBA7931002.1 hypothetical protein [Klebsiella sp. RHBSTW-00215]